MKSQCAVESCSEDMLKGQVCERHWQAYEKMRRGRGPFVPINKAADKAVCDKCGKSLPVGKFWLCQKCREKVWAESEDKPKGGMVNSLTSFIRKNCANIEENGVCLNVKIDGSTLHKKGGFCHVIFKRKPCSYFRRAVLGRADSAYPHDMFVGNPVFEQEVRDKYREIDHKVADVDAVDVRHCLDCGGSVEKRKRYCEKCLEKRRKAQYRQKRENK